MDFSSNKALVLFVAIILTGCTYSSNLQKAIEKDFGHPVVVKNTDNEKQVVLFQKKNDPNSFYLNTLPLHKLKINLSSKTSLK